MSRSKRTILPLVAMCLTGGNGSIFRHKWSEIANCSVSSFLKLQRQPSRVRTICQQTLRFLCLTSVCGDPCSSSYCTFICVTVCPRLLRVFVCCMSRACKQGYARYAKLVFLISFVQRIFLSNI
uniref:Uncharacterized protein LOC108950606 n=1 Tax=Phallusia mammillata TaxID=59560 RepID=A0A6F9DK82_9ASCI|nr:uncharacterized protein LOC108950606 [Phallusia mammillata]